MRKSEGVQLYRWLAPHYDSLFNDYRESAADPAHKHIRNPLLPDIKTACDLACGTATTALELACRGIRMFAVDLSPAMCRVAREKIRKSGLPVRVIHADMRDFRLPEPVDLVSCEFDALNHIPQKADLASVAVAVARSLRPGGYFYFDVNNRCAFETYWRSTLWIE